MKKHGLAKFGQALGNLRAGKMGDYVYHRREWTPWQLGAEDRWILKNVNIVDVDRGRLHKEKALLIDGRRFGERLTEQDVETLSGKREVALVMDGKDRFLIPGMSDLHCHLSLISEYEIRILDKIFTACI